VVAYDDAGGSVAARLWWLRHLLGEPTAVLDGGIGSWPGPLSTDPVVPVPVARAPRPWPTDRLVDADAVADRPPGAVLLDARAAGRFTGEDAVAADPRPGHVPGARSAPWAGNLDAGGRFLDPGSLRDRFVALGAGGDRDVIAYCGSGVTACHDLLALHRAGLGARTRLFPGSWSAWAADPARPAETGP
jgi:thiosulfate/3-mercaptopyruvate sulfurtransferase